jgi:hypothetical protein
MPLGVFGNAARTLLQRSGIDPESGERIEIPTGYTGHIVYTLCPVRPCEFGRGERIRTSDSCVPNAVLYQAELHPEIHDPKKPSGPALAIGDASFLLAATPSDAAKPHPLAAPISMISNDRKGAQF